MRNLKVNFSLRRVSIDLFVFSANLKIPEINRKPKTSSQMVCYWSFIHTNFTQTRVINFTEKNMPLDLNVLKYIQYTQKYMYAVVAWCTFYRSHGLSLWLKFFWECRNGENPGSLAVVKLHQESSTPESDEFVCPESTPTRLALIHTLGFPFLRWETPGASTRLIFLCSYLSRLSSSMIWILSHLGIFQICSKSREIKINEFILC